MTQISRIFQRKKEKPQERMMGDYIMGATLGIGGYAKVKLGVHKTTGEKVALKIMFADENGKMNDSKKKQLDRAVELLSKVDHDNVLKLLSYDKDGQYPEVDGTTTPCMYMSLEYAGNGELFDYLMFTGYFDEDIARSYFHQLIDGLNAIHSMGFAHRDLKPENLLLDDNFTLKIADFGFATTFRKDDIEIKMKTACGTKGYLAPEVLKGKKYEESVDIFAAGIILFITFAGCDFFFFIMFFAPFFFFFFFPPFNDAIPTDWWWNRLENGWKERASGKLLDRKQEWSKHGLFWAAHERSRKFPQNLKDFLLKMLHPNPEERPTIEQIRKENWDFYRVPNALYGSKETKPKKEATDTSSSWYQLGVKPSAELGKYLEQRKTKVRQERAKKIQDQQRNAALPEEKRARDPASQGGDFKAEGHETYDQYLIRKQYNDRVKAIDPNTEFDLYIEDFSDGTFASTPFYFFTQFPPAVVAAAFEKHVETIKDSASIKIVPKDTRCIVKCLTGEDGAPFDAEFEVRQYRFQSKYLVSCKRLRGDPLAYKQVIESFWMASSIVQIMDLSEDLMK
ncbi:Protein kinase domain containing protein [Reticulomyxa filosa]|uniref:non-specific serine/threonine protein kinase n=1 Tax=Reticulomyxa filosa TaxID=46433 RepID=X6P6T1_RETFI|nr:Protein kinase domain containing protein [Reticulomyxa filosa]|eukprot:ETO33799.1 Protein kinase domain containing protein [Reticulomyxa filosa]